MTLTKGFARNNAKAPLDQRVADMATITPNVGGSPRVGVLYAGNASIVTTLATMNVAIAAAEFVTSKSKADGVMIYTNDGTVNVPIAAAPVANSRLDVIWTKHEDNTTGDAASLPIFGVTAGVAAASPAKPAIPTGALELAVLRVYAGTTATNGGANTLTNTYQMTAPRGGLVHFRTLVELSAWTTATPGQRAIVIDSGRKYGYVAGAWGVEFTSRHKGSEGAGIAGITIGAAANLYNGLSIQTGQLTTGTTVSGGAEFFPTVLFPEAFSVVFGVQIQPIAGGLVTKSTGAVVIDTLNTGGFRALVNESGTAYVRSFLWTAFGLLP